MSVNGNVAVQRSVLPDGIAGVDTTVRKMVTMAQGVYGSKSAKVRAKAIDIIRKSGVAEKDYYGELVAIHNWVRDNVRYVHDPVGQETLSYPEETLFNSLAGDCDDLVICEIALLGSVGIESYPVVVGTSPGSFSHVYLYGIVPQSNAGRFSGATIPLDPIMKNWPAGKEAGADMGIASKKTYPELANPLTNGLPMSGLGKTPRRRNRKPGISDLGQLGAYAVAPAYVDEQEEAQANRICIPSNMSMYTHRDKTVANGTRATIKPEGLDAMFSGLGAATADEIAANSSTQSGGYLSSTSAGDGGSVIKSGGQLVPQGFIRDEPDLTQSMAMTPAPASRLGPNGPIFAQRASQNRGAIDPRTNPNVQHVKGGAIKWGGHVKRNVGGKRYDLPGVQQALRAAGGLSPNPVALNRSTPVVSVSSVMPMDRIGARAMPAQSLSGALASAEAELAATLPAARVAMRKSQQSQALAHADNWRSQAQHLNARAKSLEGTVLSLRQKMRDQALAGTSRRRNGVRAAAVQAGQQSILRKDQMSFAPTPPPGSVNGLGSWVHRLNTMSSSRVPYVAGKAVPVGPRYTTSGRIGARRAQGLTEMRGTQPVTVAGFGDISLSSPLVWGPALAFIGVFAFMKLRKGSTVTP